MEKRFSVSELEKLTPQELAELLSNLVRISGHPAFPHIWNGIRECLHAQKEEVSLTLDMQRRQWPKTLLVFLLLRASEERSRLRGIERTFGVSRTSVLGWMKKSRKAAGPERNCARA
jgi:hypothetical protein